MNRPYGMGDATGGPPPRAELGARWGWGAAGPVPYGIILLFILLSVSIKSHAYLEYRATASIEDRSFLFDRDLFSINDNLTFDLDARVTYDDEKHFKLNLNPRIKIDFLNTDRNRLIPKEMYFNIYWDHVELTEGLQIIRWGVSNSFNPTDVLMRKDLEDFFYNPEVMAELTSALKLHFGNIGLHMGILPYLREADLPQLNSRFPIQGEANNIPYTLLDDQQSLDYPKAIGGFLAIKATVGQADFSVNYYHGPERDPGFVLAIDDQGALRMQPFYYVKDMVGLNAEISIKNFVLHLESAFTFLPFNDPVPHVIGFEDNNAIPENYFQFVPGVDYTFHNIGTSGDIKMSVEYLGELEHENTLRSFRPFKNDIFIGAQYDLNNALSTSFSVGIFEDLSQLEMIGYVNFSTKVYKDFKIEVEGLFVKPGSDNNTPFSFFPNNTSVMVNLSYSFGERFP